MKAGEVLAQPATTATGLLLLPAGTELTERHLQRLTDAGVTAVVLRRSRAAQQAELLAERTAIDERFTGHDDDPVMQELKALIISQLERGAS